MIRGLRFTTKAEGPGRGWWAPPKGTHGSSEGGTLATGKNELYRWANLAEAVDVSWKPFRKDNPQTSFSLDVTDKQDFYFAPHKVLTSESWVTNTYGRFILDKKVLKEGGWSKDPNLRAEGAWRWKPGNIGKRAQELDLGFHGRVYSNAIKAFEITSLHKDGSLKDVQAILKHRFDRDIPIIETSVRNITL